MAEPKTETKAAKTRDPSEYRVEYSSGPPGQEMSQWDQAFVGTFPNSAKAISWIKKEGVNSKSYRVIRVVAGPFKISTETTTKRTLS